MSNPRSPKPNQNQLQTIDAAALAQVSGGATTTTSTSNDQVLTALTGVLDSLQSLAHQNTSGGFNTHEMLMLMMVMQRNQQQVAVAANPFPWGQEPIIRYY